MNILFSPIVHPTWAQFNDFHKYVEYLEKTYSHKYGMVKVVPPKGWKATSQPLINIDDIVIPGPIEQNAFGRAGCYECIHISCKSMKVGQFRKKTKSFQNLTDGLTADEIENLFWKNVAFSSPLYAADIKLNLMDQSSGSWNLNNLDSVLSQGMKFPLPGVNTSYCYFGSWKSFFCWHTQDMELSAINFLHSGKPKFWYSVTPSNRKIIENEVKIQFSSKYQKCHEHVRHKTTLMNPYLLKQKYPDLLIQKQVQYPGQFILAFSGAYHSGFNSGFNVAEAVNYATFKWLKDIKLANYCKCRKDSVRISQQELANQLINSKLKNRIQVRQFFKQTQLSIEQQQTKQINRTNDRIFRKNQIQKDRVLVEKAFRYKKINKNALKVKIHGEEFKIDNWAQCQKCQKWRRIDFKIKKGATFTCRKAGSNCLRKQESSSQYITLPQTQKAQKI